MLYVKPSEFGVNSRIIRQDSLPSSPLFYFENRHRIYLSNEDTAKSLPSNTIGKHLKSKTPKLSL